MKTDERTVHFYDLKMRSYSRSEGITNPACANIRDVLEVIYNRYQLIGTELVNRPTLTVEVADASFDSSTGILCLLINKADGDRSDITFKDFGSKARRKGNKQKSEGVESSSHVVIRPNPDGVSALALMTMGSGVSSSAIEKILGIALAEIKNDPLAASIFRFKNPSGEERNGIPVTYGVRYAFDCLGFKGTVLDEALSKGVFESMQLVAHGRQKFDAGGNLQIDEFSLAVKAVIPEVVTGAAIKNAFRHFMRNKPLHEYDQLRIRYRKQDGESAVASLEASNLDAAFTKREKIKLAVGLDEQQLKFSNDIIEKMHRLL